jgi:S1-C subfamily serine protease
MNPHMARANIYKRVVRLTTSAGIGTGFTVDHDDRCYVVTARHVLPPGGGQVTVDRLGCSWSGHVQTLPGVHPDSDIAVFQVPDDFALTDLPIELTSDHIIFSSEAFFFGYPFGLALHLDAADQLPLVKRATVSGMRRENGLGFYYLDGLNNPGFSGGPVSVTRLDQKTQVFAVVSGYRPDWQQLMVAGQAIENAYVRENTGIIIAFDIEEAVKALRAHKP